MRTNGFGDGGGELGKRAFSRGGSFDPIKPGGQHERGDDLDLALSVPWSVAESVAEIGGFVEALVEGGAQQASPQA